MAIYLISFAVISLIVLSMSVGVIFANKPIKGSCGGMAALGIDTSCDICGGDTKKCDEEQQRNQAGASVKQNDLAYDASSSASK